MINNPDGILEGILPHTVLVVSGGNHMLDSGKTSLHEAILFSKCAALSDAKASEMGPEEEVPAYAPFIEAGHLFKGVLAHNYTPSSGGAWELQEFARVRCALKDANSVGVVWVVLSLEYTQWKKHLVAITQGDHSHVTSGDPDLPNSGGEIGYPYNKVNLCPKLRLLCFTKDDKSSLDLGRGGSYILGIGIGLLWLTKSHEPGVAVYHL